MSRPAHAHRKKTTVPSRWRKGELRKEAGKLRGREKAGKEVRGEDLELLGGDRGVTRDESGEVTDGSCDILERGATSKRSRSGDVAQVSSLEIGDLDIEDCRSAKEIWDRLYLLEGTELKAHLDGFLRLLLKASGAGIRYSDEDKSLMFLDTLPGSFDMLKFQWRMMPEERKSFVELRRQYNSDDRGSRQWRPEERDLSRVRCYRCQEMGHYKRD